MSTRFKLCLAPVLLAGVFVGQHLTASPVPVADVGATCFGGWGSCGVDTTRTTTLRVLHKTTDATPVPVAPDTQDVWYVTATYSPTTPPACGDTQYYATVTVTNNGNGYTVTCTGCTATPFNSVGICAPTLCASGTDNEYTVKLDMDQYDAALKQIRTVNYSSTNVDDGNEIDSSCNTGSSVSPTSQSWSGDDTTFPCSFDCTNDTLITITY